MLTILSLRGILLDIGERMIYTAIFQNEQGKYSFENHVSSHDRSVAWHEIHKQRSDREKRLVLLVDGQASVRTFDDVVDTSE